MSTLNFSDLFWIALIVTSAVWYFGTEAQSERIETKLDRILKHLGLDDNDDEPMRQ